MELKELLSILKDGESVMVEFKTLISKELGKSICAFANTKGGRVLVGVKDNGDPVGLKMEKIEDEIYRYLQMLKPMPKIEIEYFPLGGVKIVIVNVEESSVLVAHNNTVYIRVGASNYPLSIDEVIEKSAESLRIFFDQIMTKIPAIKLDKKILRRYLAVRQKIRGVGRNVDLMDLAVKLKILRRKEKALFLTNAGILCFVKNPQEHIGNSVVRLVKFDDEEMKTYSQQLEFVGPLQDIVNKVEEYFIENLGKVGGFTVGFKRQEYLEYPLGALREAVINAVIHRNYFDAADIRIFIFPDRIEIRNPGSFPPGVSVDNPEHKPRNPQIAQFFYDWGLTDKYGSGINKIKREISEHPLAGVKFQIKPYSTAVIFYKILSDVDLDSVNVKILETLKGGSKGSGAVARAIGLSRQSTIERLKNLNGIGFVKQEGKGSQSVYMLTKLIR